MQSNGMGARIARGRWRLAGWRFISGIGALWRWLRFAASVRRQRIDLAELDDRLLEDIGISPRQARREMSRSVWDFRHPDRK